MIIDELPYRPIVDVPAEEAAEPGLGALRTELGNLPLHRLDVTATITGLAAGVELVQGFRNPHPVPLEATYVFPLPDRSAVTGMRMAAADRVVEGVLRERGEARAAYDEALAAGQRAAIAEEERTDVFTMRVGNILPGERVTVTLALAGPLSLVDGEAEFRFPLVVAPRYIPGTPLPGESVGDGYAPDTGAVPDASRITPPILLPGFPNPVHLSLGVRVDPAGLPLSGVASSLHAVSESNGWIRVMPGERVNRDFILRLRYGTGAEALTLVPDVDGDEGTYQLTVLPPATDAATRPRDVVLVLDRSGSMGGWKMVAARRAAARIVDTLTDADRFAVLAFDTVVERPDGLPAGLVAATDRHRYRAVEHLARVDARGGTELLAPLRQGLALLGDEERDRVLVLVTDGQVGNEDEILRELTPALADVRMHTVGIDQAVNAGFLGRLASVGGGRCELVESEERLDGAMDRIHRRIGSAVVTGLRLLGPDDPAGLTLLDDTATPARIPDLFPGVPLVIRGRYRGRPTGTVSVAGTHRDGTPWRVDVTATGAAAGPEASAVPAVWARSRVRDLEDRYAVAGTEDLARTIVDTSLRHGVVSRFTAFVAVDPSVVTEAGPGHRVIQPVEQPAGWAGPAGGTALAYGAAPDSGTARFKRAFGRADRRAIQPATPFSPAAQPPPAPPATPAPPSPAIPYAVPAQAALPSDPIPPPQPAPTSQPVLPGQPATEQANSPSQGYPQGQGYPSGQANPPARGERRAQAAPPVGGQPTPPPPPTPRPARPPWVSRAEAADDPEVGEPAGLYLRISPEIHERLVAELTRLRDGAGDPPWIRRELLDDLASRLDALALDRTTPSGLTDQLRALATDLRDDATPLDDRWTRAVTALEELIGPAPAPASRRAAAFWKH